MGISTGSKLIWGLTAGELREGLPEPLKARLSEEGFYGVAGEDGDLGLAYASPWYDSDEDDRVWGIQLAGGWNAYSKIDHAALPAAITDAAAAFKEKTGLDGRLYVSAHVT